MTEHCSDCAPAHTGYQGWTNYETWAFALHQDNDKGSYLWPREMARDALSSAPEHENVIDGTWTAEQAARFTLADRLKDEAEDAMPELEAPWSDLLRSAFGEIDWHEIAENLIQEVKAES